MAITKIATDGADYCKLKFDKDLSIYSALASKEALDQALGDYQDYELDLSEVEEIDSAGVQILLSFCRHLISLERRFTITALSPAVQTIIQRYQLTEMMPLNLDETPDDMMA